VTTVPGRLPAFGDTRAMISACDYGAGRVEGAQLMATPVSDRLREAMNDHDIDAFVGCFTPDYRSEQPAHPDRAFGGRDQGRTNWSAIFREIPYV
jgi:hypothetical protein